MENDNNDYSQRQDHEYSDHSGPRRHSHRHSTKKRWILGLSIALFVETLAIFGILIWSTKLQEQVRDHFAREKELGQMIKDSKTELEAQRWEFNKLKAEQAKTCLPNLIPLKFDKVLEINNEYVKSGLFMLTGKKDSKYLEFKFVLQNNTQSNVVPRFDVVFFNTSGKQIGLTPLGYTKDEPAPTRESMERGEVRSYDGTFPININEGQPEFIMVKIRSEK